MIKSDLQLERTRKRISELDEEISTLRQEMKGELLSFFLEPLETELKELRHQIHEYLCIKELPLSIAVEGHLQKPILLDNISPLLAQLRIAAKLTQAQLAERLNWKQSNVSRFENENYGSHTISKISEYTSALGVWLHLTPSMSEKPPRVRYNIEVSTTDYSLADQLFTAGTGIGRPSSILGYTSSGTAQTFGQVRIVATADKETQIIDAKTGSASNAFMTTN